MNEHPLTRALTLLAEEGVPEDLDLRASIHRRLEMSKAQSRKGVFPMKASFTQPRRLTASITIFVFLLLTAFLLTSQGQTWAQELFQFFIPAESDTFPIPTEQVLPAPDTPTPGPTYIPELENSAVTAMPEDSADSMDNPCVSYEELKDYFCQIQEVEAQAGFDAKELPVDPQGMEFSKASFNYERKVIAMEFEVISGGGYLYLHQGIEDDQPQGEWDKVPAEGIRLVTVNGQYAELASGTFVVYPNATEATWEPDGSLLRLRWREGDYWFSLEKLGDPYPIEWMDGDALIELAESLVDDRDLNAHMPVETETPDVEDTDWEFFLSADEAQQRSGFDVLMPTWLPDFLFFREAAFDPHQRQVVVSYDVIYPHDPNVAGNGITLIQQPILEDGESCEICSFVGASAEIEKVQIGHIPGEYVVGVWQAIGDTGQWGWVSDPYLQRLRWHSDGMAFELLSFVYPDDLTKADLIAIAKSLR